MTDQATRVVPAGWYQDPATPEQVRWWNGLAWTEHVREKPTVSQTVTAAGAAASAAAQGVTIRTTAEATETAEQRSAVRDLERQFGIGTSENEIIGAAALDRTGATVASSAHPATGSTVQATVAGGRRGMTARTATGSAWLIALAPVLTLVLGIVAAYIYFYVLETPIVFVVAFALPYLLVILWALSDSRALTGRRLTPPSPAFALLTSLGYLIARRARVAGSGPLAMLLVVGVLAFGLVPTVAVMGQLNGLEAALKIQHTISDDYVTHGEAISVSCPAFVDASKPGTLYTCDATTSIGTVREIWVSVDGTDGRFSYAFAV